MFLALSLVYHVHQAMNLSMYHVFGDPTICSVVKLSSSSTSPSAVRTIGVRFKTRLPRVRCKSQVQHLSYLFSFATPALVESLGIALLGLTDTRRKVTCGQLERV